MRPLDNAQQCNQTTRIGDDDPIAIFARWQCNGDTLGAEQPGHAHIYTLIKGTTGRLVAGTMVRLPTVYPTAYCLPEEAIKNEREYDVYDSHIAGRVKKITVEKSGEVVVTMEHLCKNNPVGRVKVQIPGQGNLDWDGPEDEAGITGRAVVINMTQTCCNTG